MKILNIGSCNIDYVYSLDHIVVVFGGLDGKGCGIVAEVIYCLRRKILADTVAAHICAVSKLGRFYVVNTRLVLFKRQKVH